MDDLIIHAIRAALSQHGMDNIRIHHICNKSYNGPTIDQIWLCNNQRSVEPRWCIINVHGTKLSINNGRNYNSQSQIDLCRPNSIEILGNILANAITTTALFRQDTD